MATSTPFRPNSRRERLEWIAARMKERWSQLPQYANYTDRDWIRISSPGSSLLSMPVLDPSCKVTMPADY
jgi:hypothetical protein